MIGVVKSDMELKLNDTIKTCEVFAKFSENVFKSTIYKRVVIEWE